MSDGSLSQDEIDALLAGTSDIDLGDSGGGAAAGSAVGPDVQQALQAALGETVGQQQSNMSMITGKNVQLQPPTVNAGVPGGLSGQLVQIAYHFGDQGQHLYLLTSEDAVTLASASMGLDGVEIDDASLNAVQEVFSQVSGPVINTLSDKSGMTIMPNPAEAKVVDAASIEAPPDPIYARYTVVLDDNETATIYELFEANFVAKLSGAAGQAQAGPAPMQQQAAPMQQQMAGFGGAPAGGGMAGMAGMGGGMPGGMSVQSVQFPSLQGAGGVGEQGNIGLLMDVYMEMTVELGRTKKLIREILGMGEGTIIELDKLAGEPVDILVNHKLIAKGEVVVIDENFGVRVTEIVSPMERVSDMT